MMSDRTEAEADMLRDLADVLLALSDRARHEAAMARIDAVRREAAVARETLAMVEEEERDEAADWGDWKFHQDHDQ